MITPALENERTLAHILGISEDVAAARLGSTYAITAATGEAVLFGKEVDELLERTITPATDLKHCDIEIVIGLPPTQTSAKKIYVSISGDAVRISHSSLPIEPTVSLHGIQRLIGACYVASVAISTVIEGINASAQDPFVVKFDALGATRDVLDHPIRLNDTVLAGAGAVGNGFLRAARHLNVEGELTIVDPKAVGGGNPNRCLYFNQADVGKPKAERLSVLAQPDFSRLKLKFFDGTFSELRKSRDKIRRVIVGTDSRPVRRSIQSELPLEIIDASTTDTSEVVVHSHRQPTADACLACIYRHIPDEDARAKDIAAGLGVDLDDVKFGGLIDDRVALRIAEKHPHLDPSYLKGKAFDSMFRELCAEQLLTSSGGEQVLAPFAFVSNLAGALLALELARFESGARFKDRKNILCVNPWAPPHNRLRSIRSRFEYCEFCSKPDAETALRFVWPELEAK